MLLAWLLQDFTDLFARDSRARVALWFDAKHEFQPILLEIEAHFAAQGIVLLAYAPEQQHGSLWLKWAAEVGTSNRVVLWLPYPREALENGADDGMRLDPLLEYAYSGLTWLIDGKAPTLFGFLKKHGVPLPDKRADQDALWRNGAESLLAKYTRAYLRRDNAFWHSRPLSAALIQESIVGDVQERLLAFLADPIHEWERLTQLGIAPEFAAQVEAHYFSTETLPLDPAQWARAFVSAVILLEVFIETGTPADFPFALQLPTVAKRKAVFHLWRHWVRDRDHQETYRRWALELDPALDMRAWAGRWNGRPQALHTLAAERWEACLTDLRACGDSETALVDWLTQGVTAWQIESKGFWARETATLPGWQLLLDLAHLMTQARQATASAASLTAPAALVEAYAHDWHQIDLAHWRLLTAIRRTDGLELLATLADRFYWGYLDTVNRAFYAAYRDGTTWPPAGCVSVRDLAPQLYAEKPSKRAILMVDALRFDLAAALLEQLKDLGEARLTAYLANVPSETWVGMTSLLPEVDTRLNLDGGTPHLPSASAGGDLCFRPVRWKVLEAAGAAPLSKEKQTRRDELHHLHDLAATPANLPNLLVLFERGLDSLGHPTGYAVLQHFDEVLREVAQAVRRLRSWGYTEIHLVTDHGFVLLHNSANLQLIDAPRDRFAILSARYGLLPAAHVGGLPMTTVPFALDPEWRVALSPGLRSFSAPGEFFHGGGTLQEVVIPHLRLTFAAPSARMRVRASLPQIEIATLSVKVDLFPEIPPAQELFQGAPESVWVRVFLGTPDAPLSNEKLVEIHPEQTGSFSVTLFLKRESTIPAKTEIPVQVLDRDSGQTYATGLFVRALRDLN